MTLEKLLDKSPESLYWLGFLFADGTREGDHRITVRLNVQDKNHLEKLKDYLDITRELQYYSCQDAINLNLYGKEYIKQITEQYDWHEIKTYDPPDIDVFKDLGMLNTIFWFIGFIDGDGYIGLQYKRKDAIISLHIHNSWKPVVDFINNIINQYFEITTPPSHVLKSGALRYSITNTRLVIKLKKLANLYKLPILERKWDKIDESRIHREDKSNSLKQEIFKLREEGYRLKDIAEELDINYNTMLYYLYKKK